MNNRVPFCDASFSNGGGIDRTFSSRAPAGLSRKEYNKVLKERDEAVAELEARPALIAEMILHNGKIIIVDKDFSIVQAVAIRDGKFLAVGSDTEVKVYTGPKTKMIDLKGKIVIHGLIDSRCHPSANLLVVKFPNVSTSALWGSCHAANSL